MSTNSKIKCWLSIFKRIKVHQKYECILWLYEIISYHFAFWIRLHMMALTSSNILSLLHLDEIFPSVSSVVIFFTYMVVCLQQALLVTASRTENEKTYPYNPATVVMLTEVVKLVLAFAFYIKRLLFLLPKYVIFCFRYTVIIDNTTIL